MTTILTMDYFSHRQKKQRPNKLKHTIHGKTKNTEGQGNQPNQGREKQNDQC